jgi:hypothetical protein
VAVIFRAGLGIVYLAAFLSLAVQIGDLVGSRGLLPLRDVLAALRATHPGWLARLHAFPTLLWLEPGDAAIRILPIAGAALSLLLIAGIGGRIVSFSLWLLYLSCIAAGRDFFYYQWDNLLLETGLLAVFLPARGSLADLLRRRPLPEPSPIVVFLVRWVLFRLLFESGWAKIVYGADDWLTLKAMTYYYETAPLPSWGGWLAHQAPLWFHQASALFTFLVELVLSLFIFLPRRLRLVFFLPHLPFQLSIAATSNYGFFNLLSIVLSLMVLEDRDLPEVARAAGPPVAAAPAAAGWRGRAARLLPWPLAALLVAASLLEASNYFLRGSAFDTALDPARAWYAPFRSVNVYHLFPGIVRERIVAEIEGSRDGTEWLPYRLRYAPGDPQERPPTTLLHNPRFPFHFSFLTLGRGRRDLEYLQNLADRLCCDPGAVGDLLEPSPFLEDPPDQLRISYYRYRFGTWSDLRTFGAYWRRQAVGQPSRPVVCSCPGRK